jgi:O-methyltransferase
MPGLRKLVKRMVPDAMLLAARAVREPALVFGNRDDLREVVAFVRRGRGVSLPRRLSLAQSLYQISYEIDCPHTQVEMLSFIRVVLDMPREVPGVVVEAGCFKGGSTAKFSLAARLAGRRLVVFDSFEGLPDNREAHGVSIFGDVPDFSPGKYRGDLDEVRENVCRRGAPDVCTYVKGWFDQSVPAFREPIAALYLDVDLASSTRTCLKHLYPLISSGGYVFSQDGHLPLVIEVLRDAEFWEREVGAEAPRFRGLGRSKLISAQKH